MVQNISTFRSNQARAEGKDKRIEPKKLQPRNRDVGSTNTIAYLQILGTGMDTHDTLPSVLLFFDKQRFIFNAGEGLQRFCAEHKIKLSKIDHIFLTRVCSETAGGLPGLLLTLAGMGQGMSVNIWGPSDLKVLVEAVKSFVPHSAVVHTHFISHSSMEHTRSCGLATCSRNVAMADRNNSADSFPPSELVKISAILLTPHCQEGSDVKPSDISVIYVCELHEIKGKFHIEKAEELGVEIKKKYGELKNGIPVKSDRFDKMVYPSDVVDPPIPGPVVFIVDCPTESHAKELLAVHNCYFSELQNKKTVNCIIHITPASVTTCPSYQEWMRKFDSAQHIMAGYSMKHANIPVLKSSARIATRLNYLCPQLVPNPGVSDFPQCDATASGSISSNEGPNLKLYEGTSFENLLKFKLLPHADMGLDKSSVPSLMVSSEVIAELISEIPEIVGAAEQVSQRWQKPIEMEDKAKKVQDSDVSIENSLFDSNELPSCLENVRRDDLEIVLLGTGSSQPSKYRNVSSIYINLFSKGSLLLDCGEGTLAQLRRRYGINGADSAVRNLRCIWISHIHADHHAGLVRILAVRRDLLKEVPHEPLLVVGPIQLKIFVDAYQKLEDLDMLFLDCRNTMKDSWNALTAETRSKKSPICPSCLTDDEDMNSLKHDSKRIRLSIPEDNTAPSSLLASLKSILIEAGLERLISFPVVHCPQSFGVVLKAAERMNSVGKVIPGWKIVYSGDTRPCAEVIEASHGATVLIHEATFEDSMVEEAVVKNHSTSNEAIEVGESAGAYRIILTHFSQRYPKIPAFNGMSVEKTCIAFDLMSVNLADLPPLPKVLPYLKLLFRNEMITDS